MEAPQQTDIKPATCVNHPGDRAVTNLDGENLCLSCANAWVRAEGQWQAAAEQEEAPE